MALKPSSVPPEWRSLVNKADKHREQGPGCDACRECPKCSKNRGAYPDGWCRECLNCGCWNTGRFGRGLFGRALMFPSRLRDITECEGAKVVRLDGFRIECFPRTVDGKAIESLKGKLVSGWSEFNGCIRFTDVNQNVANEISGLMNWRFPDA